MNTVASPCDNFHEYACGNYATVNELLPDEGISNTMTKLDKGTSAKLKALVEAPITNDDTVWDRQCKQFYARCLDEGKVVLHTV